jgi:arabinofuranosyltransferase
MTTVSTELFSDSRGVRSITLWACFLTALAVSLAWSWYFLPNYVDDSLIAYRYSERLLQGHGLTWNDNEYVEGYSDLLWVLLVAAGGLVQPNLILVGWTLGILANAATLGAVAWAFGRSSGGTPIPLATGLFVLSFSSCFAFWGGGGLETALVEALLAWALATVYRETTGQFGWVCPGLFLGLLSVTRPDGILLSIGVVVGLLLRDGTHRTVLHHAFRLLILPIAFTAAQTGFRLAYYGALVPNTAHAKLAFTPERLLSGSLYVVHGALANCVPLVLVIALLVWRSRRRVPLGECWTFLAPGILWLVYVNLIGGDPFEYYRQWMPALVCLAFALSGLLMAVASVPRRQLAFVLSIAAISHIGVQQVVDPYASQQIVTPEIARLMSLAKKARPSTTAATLSEVRRNLESCFAFGHFLRDAFSKQRPLIAVINAGCIPYASQLPSLDMLGLTDAHIAHHRPPNMGKGLLAHELGDATYVLARKPDLIAFCGPPQVLAEPCFRSEIELAQMPEFQRNYRRIFVRAGSVDAAVWTRIEDGRLGISRTVDTIQIPGYLLASRPGTRVVIDLAGKPATLLETGDAVIESVYLPTGIWEVSLQSDTLDRLQLATLRTPESKVAQPTELRIVSGGAGESFRVFGGRGLIYAITARRVG